MLSRLFIGTTFLLASLVPAVAVPLGEAVSADGECRAVLTISPDHPCLADIITLTLDVTCPEGKTVSFPPFGDRLGELSIVDIKTTDRQLILTAKPERGGKTPIWKMKIRCGEQELVIPAAVLNIATSIDVETASLADIGLATEPIPKPPWYYYAIVAALILVALALLWLLSRRKQKALPEGITPLSAQELALRRLVALLESRKHESDVKGFFVELSDIVRWYVERLTGIRAPELTTEEFLHKIAHSTAHSTDSLDTLAPFLEAADVVKFAKHVPTNDEIMLAFRRAEQFIRNEEEVFLLSEPPFSRYSASSDKRQPFS